MAAMDFFEHQAVAKRNTRLLVILFGAAVLCLLTLTGLLVAAFSGGLVSDAETTSGQTEFLWHWDIILASIGMALSAISLAVLYKWMTLKGGGKVIAESLGGRRLSPDSREPIERKILNVVEEMAIAANMPVPPVYLLENEQGINAFAAGYSPQDAVIGITRGCVENLTRDQLQGVVAHEIAHILNGDMRLNIRIIAILNGILFISHAGYLLLRTGMYSRRNDKNPLPILGIGLLIIGAIGVLFGNIIKAAVSRQREYLADASAVQFTRDPNGIGGALEQIGALQSGSKVENKNADEAAHLFFGQAISKAMSIFATHPPLEKRIKRIRPSWDGQFRANPPQQLKEELAEEAQRGPAALARDGFGILTPGSRSGTGMVGVLAASAAIEAALGETEHSKAQATEPAATETDAANSADDVHLIAEARDQVGAEALVLAMALSAEADIQAKQLAHIKQQHGDDLATRTLADYGKLESLSLESRLALVERAIPALKTLDKTTAYALIDSLNTVIAADQQTSLYEWCLAQIVTRYVRAEFEPNRKVKKVDVRRQSDAEFTLSVLAWFGHDSDEAALQAFQAAAAIYGKRLQPFRQQPYSFAELGDCLDRINVWSVGDKERIVKAWIMCVRHDGEITVVEQKLLLTLCACIGEPLPDLEF
ncbi:MAG: M48 family metallopeptidase [Aliidiomarina sp.]|uniref:M48 family metallopeptidase n=1 Tax=Aliidiomarina sp. TaxID=1872439 RepID=UPI0025BC0A57|nr:M48 family metallopeptidase [Aliidiomarina sp.]MCH8500858.1 M48 family metallopeptidase [Aliidiomarina sp.]